MKPAKAPVGFFVSDQLAFVFDDPGALGDRPQGEDAAAMDRRSPHNDTPKNLFALSLFHISRILRAPAALNPYPSI
jgi:hypothetical protein